MNYYLIIGRIIGDDEDTPIHIQALTVEEACAQYRDEMYGMEGWGPDEIGHAECNGEGVVINHAFRSATPMHIDFPRYPEPKPDDDDGPEPPYAGYESEAQLRRMAEVRRLEALRREGLIP